MPRAAEFELGCREEEEDDSEQCEEHSEEQQGETIAAIVMNGLVV